ncbi:MAG TPA: GTP cyclohydrolase II [Candidatus Paceibacterota bacterium]|nr:GTP cyclohydrolase II [Candidatus Paceibacterota bacterium]
MQHRFTETDIQTTNGQFRLRVYADAHGKETVVLYTPRLDVSKPVLVRVHSECLTGDTLGSLQCDCGEQLHQALARISASGNGVLIYLRQEGRGIGLFEKIQSYQLQAKGFDTFEANVMLGHRPDERSYEWAKIALADLGISTIQLLTNNPSKVSEIAKLGVTVTGRVPLVVEANQFNRRYFDAKRDKFKHFFHAEVSYYFYQFHAANPSEVEEIGEFLRGRHRDPLLKICVGVSADNAVFDDEAARARIRNIFSSCELYEGFVPILHFSFKNSVNAVRDVERIKENMPFVQYVQTNDVPSGDLAPILRACELFLADIPLSDESFSLVHNEVFRKAIADYKAFVLLDNSQGKGVRESKASLQKKIDTLLSYGLNDIAIFGGFGPDDLDTYFELRRHYRINFSIDAETKLSTDGKLDIEKTKLYLSQLLRFDDPKEAGVEQTRSFLRQSERNDWSVAQVASKTFQVHPAVFNPDPFPSTEWFAHRVIERTKGATDFCEIGCGAGAIACLAALAHPNLNVVATDINPFATETTKLNAEQLGVAERVAVYTGDVFDGLPKDSKFDVIFWSLPFGFLDPGVPVDYREMQVFDPGYRATRKFIHQAKTYLKPGGRLLLGFSSDLGHGELLEELASDERLRLTKVAEQAMKETEEVTFDLLEGHYLSTVA